MQVYAIGFSTALACHERRSPAQNSEALEVYTHECDHGLESEMLPVIVGELSSSLLTS